MSNEYVFAKKTLNMICIDKSTHTGEYAIGWHANAKCGGDSLLTLDVHFHEH